MQTTLIKKKNAMPCRDLDRCHDGKGAIHWREVLDSQDPGGGRIQFVHDDVLPPGTSIGIHRHNGEQEYHYIVSGCGVMTLDGNEYEVSDGDITAVFPGGAHGLENRSDRDLRILVICVGSGGQP
jgi:uncharacterized cupin superfamily protein